MQNKSKEAQTTAITTLSHIHPLSTIKGKLKSREKRCKYKITPACVIKEKTEELGEKPFRYPPSGKMIHYRIKLEYMNNKRPSKPSLPHVPKPSKLLLPTDFSEPCLL